MNCSIPSSIAALLVGAASSFAQEVPLDADIVLMGELHDVPAHHVNQARWIERMAPAAIVFEMLEPEQGPTATDLQDEPAETLGAALAWEDRGWPDFATYAPIFEAADGARIYGAGLSRETLGRAVEKGAAAILGAEDAAVFSLDIPLPLEEQAIREDEQAQAHCGLMPPDILPGMVEAQRLRDATLARTAIRAFDETEGPVAIVTGNGHARTDWGVPVYLRAARPDLSIISIGQYVEDPGDGSFDALVVAGAYPEDRPDPCDALR